ncbi:MAG TPA: efflux transporter outer membrane subunit [Usitatibacter sp.]|jgi:multidrug efflux system outer membrane protein|nr:efflux transporter outer membrane subunit [Usitatibacter sp.]
MTFMHRALALAVAATLSGCMVGPNYQRPQEGLPPQYGEAAKPGPIAVPEKWWTLYNDPVLDQLVDSGLERNADVREAAGRVEEAEAVMAQARAAFFPIVGGQASATRGRQELQGKFATGSTYSLGLTTSFEIDIWGQLRRAQRSARDTLLASRYGKDTVALSLAGTIARTYFTALSLDSQYRASLEIADAADASYNLARRRAEGGVASDVDLAQAGALRSGARAQANEVARLRAVAVHELGVLTGRLDVKIPTKEIEQLPIPPTPPAGLPSDLLERRPDVRAAEMQLAAATERIGVARANEFPTLSLTGSLGFASNELAHLVSGENKVWSIGGNLLGPILDAGLYAARTREAEAQAHQAEAAYQRAVENSFRDVQDALSNIELSAKEETDLADSVRQVRESLRLSQLRYENGYSAYLEVLDAQRALNNQLLAYIRNRQAYLSFTVDLMNALGGGWTPPS